MSGCEKQSEVMTNQALEQLKSAFSNALGIDLNCDFDSVVYGQTLGWDSVAHMVLIAEIETMFDIMLPTDDVIGLSSFRRAKEILARNGVTFSDVEG